MAVTTTAADRAQGSRITYQPALDGIRAFAVAAVMMYHAGQSWAVGGYLGVDAFFVLSGFLITTLLVTEAARTGTIALGAFWARRARRLLPALFLVLGGVALYATAFAGTGELDRIRADGLASLGCVANWRFVFSGQSYFDAFGVPSPLRHLWSLAIEEQFYLVWPLVVFGVLRWSRGSTRALLNTIAALGCLSVVLMLLLYHPGTDPSRVYYGTDTRAQSLLVGAALAVVLFRHGPIRSLYMRNLLRAMAVIGIVYTLWAWARMSSRTDGLYQGGFLVGALAVASVIASVVQPEAGLLGRALSLRPIRWIGQISYGLYLWHWPMFLVITPSRTGLHGTVLLLARVAASISIATLSYYLVEQPIRHGALRRWRAWTVAPIAASVVVVALIVTTVGAQPSVAQQTVNALGKGPPPSVPVKADPSATAPPTKVLVVGDSVAATMALGLVRAQQTDHLLLWNRGVLGCGISRGGDVLEGGQLQHQSSSCNNWPTRWGQLLDQFHPDVVVMLVGAWDVLDRRINGQWLKLGTPEHDAYFLQTVSDAVNLLGSRGAHVVILTTPYFSRPDLTVPDPVRWIEYDPSRVDRLNLLFRTWMTQNSGKATLVDLNRFVSPGGHFADTVNGINIRDDGVHFSPSGADYVADWLGPRLRDIGTGVTRTPYPGVTIR
jgi:peptidoglycan/LPS O-acetylase OafA/YrhL